MNRNMFAGGPTQVALAGDRQGWATLTLSDGESEGLADAARLSHCDPAADPAGFRAEARRGWAALGADTIDALEMLARGGTPRPELYVTNLPVDPNLPPTPLEGQWTDSVASTHGEFLMVTFSLACGLPISYLDQRGGRLVHDVYPTRANAYEVSSQSSSASLGFHTEMFFHPEPPDFLMLHCLRPDATGRATTSIASREDIQARLTEAQIAVLSEPRFALDLARLHGAYRFDGRLIGESDPRPVIPVIDEDVAGVQFRFEPGLTTAIDDEAHGALTAAEQAAEDVRAEGRLGKGGLLLLDNRRAVHSRSPFEAKFDGHDRWLRRMMIGSGPIATTKGFHRRHSLEIARSWEASGVELRKVPYGPGGSRVQAASSQGGAS